MVESDKISSPHELTVNKALGQVNQVRWQKDTCKSRLTWLDDWRTDRQTAWLAQSRTVWKVSQRIWRGGGRQTDRVTTCRNLCNNQDERVLAGTHSSCALRNNVVQSYLQWYPQFVFNKSSIRISEGKKRLNCMVYDPAIHWKAIPPLLPYHLAPLGSIHGAANESPTFNDAHSKLVQSLISHSSPRK